ncbi:cora-domain-containing protein, partial [Nadsonia fulvescens var. elongata DSM 6958]
RPRRLTSSSIKSDVEETGSRVSLGEETEEDVCFPILPESHTSRGIDFQEIDLFIETIRYGSEGCDSIHESDSILPEKTTNISGLVGTSEKKIPYASESVLFNDSNLNFRNSVQKNRDSNKFLREDGSIYNGGAQWPKSCIGVDRFSFFSSESEETIHALDFPSLIRQDQTFSDLFKEENGAWWLDCLNPTDAEMRMFTKAFGIHPLTAEDIRTQENREKVELFKSYYFVCFHTFNQDSNSDDFLKPVENYMVVFKNGILSFHFAQVSHPANVRRRARQLRDYVEVSADWICYALIDDITDSFAPFIHLIEREADIIEEAVLIDRETDFSVMLRRIGEARRKTMSLMRLLAGKADVIKMFAKRCNEHWDMTPKGNIGLYLGDIQDHIVTMYQNLLAYEKILSRSHGNYLAQLQVESFNANNRVTDVLGKVTVLGTCLLPLNLVTGLWGMNVHVPGQDVNSLGWFFGIAGCIIGLICTFILMTRIWLQGKTGQSNSPAVSTAKGSNGSL